MTIRLKGEQMHDGKAAQKLAAAIEVTTTVNIATLETDVAQRRLVLNLNKGNLKQKGMTAAEVKDKLERATRLYVQADKDKNPSTLTMIPGVHSEEDLAELAENPPSYTMLLQLEEKIRDMRLKGIPGIERQPSVGRQDRGVLPLDHREQPATNQRVGEHRPISNLHQQHHRDLRLPRH